MSPSIIIPDVQILVTNSKSKNSHLSSAFSNDSFNDLDRGWAMHDYN